MKPGALVAHGEHGFSMLEVLITMVIVSFGLLGVAGLQLKSLQHAHASYQRSLATVQANDLVERLWASICALPGGRDTVRDEWIETWKDDARLPDWAGALDYDASGSPPLYTITISWTDERIDMSGDGRDADQHFVYHTAIPRMSGCS